MQAAGQFASGRGEPGGHDLRGFGGAAQINNHKRAEDNEAVKIGDLETNSEAKRGRQGKGEARSRHAALLQHR